METELPTLLIGLLCYSNNDIDLLVDQVTLLPHQRRALAWLLWREAQNPCGGILGMFVFFIFTWSLVKKIKNKNRLRILRNVRRVYYKMLFQKLQIIIVCFFFASPSCLCRSYFGFSGWHGTRENSDHDCSHTGQEEEGKRGRWKKGREEAGGLDLQNW